MSDEANSDMCCCGHIRLVHTRSIDSKRCDNLMCKCGRFDLRLSATPPAALVEKMGQALEGFYMMPHASDCPDGSRLGGACNCRLRERTRAIMEAHAAYRAWKEGQK